MSESATVEYQPAPYLGHFATVTLLPWGQQTPLTWGQQTPLDALGAQASDNTRHLRSMRHLRATPHAHDTSHTNPWASVQLGSINPSAMSTAAPAPFATVLMLAFPCGVSHDIGHCSAYAIGELD